jgi:hypothetical protein
VFGASLLTLVGLLSGALGGDADASVNRSAGRVVGSLELVAATANTVRLVGWAADPRSRVQLSVVVALEGRWHVSPANRSRPDVGRALPRSGPNHGFDLSLVASTGTHRLCVAAGGAGRPLTMLGCRTITVAGNPPIGYVDDARAVAANTVRVTGWSLDPDTWVPVEVRAEVDGVPVVRERAMSRRDDIGALYPAYGPLHGFDLVVPFPVGRHTVCIWAVDIGGGADRRLGCRTLDMPSTQPIGWVDTVSTDGSDLVVAGWAYDPDAGGPSPVTVTVSRTGIDDPHSLTATASIPRPDVAAALGVRSSTGFSVRVPGVESGVRTVCVTVRNQGWGSDRSLGCRQVVVGDRRPLLFVDRIEPRRPAPGEAATGLIVSGWAADPDSSAPVTVEIRVNGVPTLVTANLPRPDVGAVFPALGSQRGFELEVPTLGPGVHRVCVTAADLGPRHADALSGDRIAPCGAVALGAVSAGTTGVASEPRRVGPDPASPVRHIDRDAGVSARLRDGSTVWFFGDSSEVTANGTVRYFVHNTSAWSAPGAPTTTRDASDGAVPYQFATPVAGSPTCPASTSQVMWPLSAVVVPVGELDRVVVYLENLCIGSASSVQSRGLAVAEWYYDPADPPDGAPIIGTVIAPRLRDDLAIGRASVMGDDGFIYTYGCDGPEGGGFFDQYGPCRVARVDPSSVTDPGAYRWWNGSSWAPSMGSAAPMSLPPGPDGPVFPVAAFTVTWDQAHGVYVFASSPWPGYTDRIAVRVATRPQGPWSGPIEVQLPGCANTVGGVQFYCYAGTAQPQLSGPGLLGLGYYDQIVSVGPSRGSYQVVTVPFTVVIASVP